MLNTYLGQKGYTILKNEITIEQQRIIREDLNVKPYVHGAPMNSAISFQVYRESTSKFYIPHYYGIKKFGPPKEFKIPCGIEINLDFNGTLRETQKQVVDTYIHHVNNNEVGGGLLELPCAFGKTILSINIISRLKKKTLIIVHKEFLMNQWIERINQFLPGARIGKIQGQIIDVDDKDIVIGMLQSLSMKEYPTSIFETFGLTIIDEVHHISSQTFSCALFKIITKYMLGLSATMNRKDGTTNIFKMFLGEVIFKGDRDDKHEVEVRAIQYSNNDDDFNKVVNDYRGNVQYTTMISKLCEYNHRSEFILRILIDMLRENPNQQIMMIAHNRNVLKYLHDAIEHRNICSVGYYLGGMKEHLLKETETKKVVIATFSMAAEALDIKTLTTLIMVTPKTDIEQSVGRILREKHSKPIVVDIIDKHDIFQRQWLKRKTFYKKNNYRIIGIDNLSYHQDTSIWKVICSEKPIKEEKENSLTGKCFLNIKNNTLSKTITK
jgi:superfamily II DNA or RNA helicase